MFYRRQLTVNFYRIHYEDTMFFYIMYVKTPIKQKSFTFVYSTMCFTRSDKTK